MPTSRAQGVLFSELFPIVKDALPILYAWYIDAHGDNSLGWKLAHRLRKILHGHWIWSDNSLICEKHYSSERMLKALQLLYDEDKTSFRSIKNISPRYRWSPGPKVLAEFVAFGLASEIEREIREKLRMQRVHISRGVVERDYILKAWEVNGQPAISISIYSHLLSQYSLREFTDNFTDVDQLINLRVKDKFSSYTGMITGVLGSLKDRREVLLKLVKHQEMHAFLNQALDDDIVIRVNQEEKADYDYASSALQIVVGDKDFLKFSLDKKGALSALHISVIERTQIIESIAHLFRNNGWIGPNAYNNISMPAMFESSESLNFSPKVRLGSGYTFTPDAQTILRELCSHKVYRVHPQIKDIGHLRIGILNFVGDALSIKPYLADICQTLENCNSPVYVTRVENLTGESIEEMQTVIKNMSQDNPHIILAFMPGFPGNDSDTEENLYTRFKSITTNRGLPSQVIFESTLDKSFAVDNVVLGVLSKTGNIPYVLSEPLPYTDLIVGIDIVRRRQSESVDLSTITRIHTANGELLRYIIYIDRMEGEVLPQSVIQRVLPRDIFAHKRAVIQRDGSFRDYEKQDLEEWAKEIGAIFHLVEVNKIAVPRIYMRNKDGIRSAPKGTLLKLSEYEGFVVTTNMQNRSMALPLTVKTDGTLSIEQATHAVLALTMLHYGSVLPPRLPVTIHGSDRIAKLLLNGIKPRLLEGDIPFWL